MPNMTLSINKEKILMVCLKHDHKQLLVCSLHNHTQSHYNFCSVFSQCIQVLFRDLGVRSGTVAV